MTPATPPSVPPRTSPAGESVLGEVAVGGQAPRSGQGQGSPAGGARNVQRTGDGRAAGSPLRSSGQQRLHDEVVRKLAVRLSQQHRREGIQVVANPGRHRCCGVGTDLALYPDLVLLDSEGQVLGIYEVETPDSVCLAHASTQWRAFAALGIPFFLVVPEQVEWVAREILGHLGIRPARLYLF